MSQFQNIDDCAPAQLFHYHTVMVLKKNSFEYSVIGLVCN